MNYKKNKSNVDLICNISELSAIFNKASRLDNLLGKVVEMIADHMRVSVCSVYLFEDNRDELVLSATAGPDTEKVGEVRLKANHGLIGTALKELRPILVNKASGHVPFESIEQAKESPYHSFLVVPLLRGLERLGIIILEHTDLSYFNDNDVKAMKAIAAQLASTVDSAQLFMRLHRKRLDETEPEEEKADTWLEFVKGQPASNGIAIGTLSKLQGNSVDILSHFKDYKNHDYVLEDFHKALQETENQLIDLQREMDENQYDIASLIFSTHLLIIKDSLFSGAMEEKIKNGVVPVEAIALVVDQYTQLFSKSSNARLAEKVQDIRDLGHRLLSNLVGLDVDDVDYKGHVIVSEELVPSVLLRLATQRAAAIIIVGSSVTAHLSILAQSLEIPVLFCNETRLFDLPEHETILVDGNHGGIFIDPSDDVIANFKSVLEAHNLLESDSQLSSEAVTQDKQQIKVLANVNLLSELRIVKKMNVEGIGLYRSEFPFIIRNSFPSEEEQYRIYRTILETMNGKEVTFRTLDVGGDKMLSYYSHVDEANPFLGLRAIRFSLRNVDIFSQQLRALLRAGKGYDLKIMFPLVSSVDDFIQAQEIVYNCCDELKKEKIPYHPRPQIGVMIELPSAAEITADLAEHADFVCIGSNDLVQYLLGVDRTNKEISDLYQSHHPAVLRILKRIVDAVDKAGKKVTLCGEIGANEKMLPFLLGIGIRRISIAPKQIPRIQNKIRELDTRKAGDLAQQLLRLNRIDEIGQALGYEKEVLEK